MKILELYQICHKTISHKHILTIEKMLFGKVKVSKTHKKWAKKTYPKKLFTKNQLGDHLQKKMAYNFW